MCEIDILPGLPESCRCSEVEAAKGKQPASSPYVSMSSMRAAWHASCPVVPSF